MLDDRIAYVDDLIVGAEAEVVVLAARGAVDPLALLAIEWLLFAIASDNVLTKLRAELDQEITKVANDREIPQNSVFGKKPIIRGKPDQADKSATNQGDHAY